LFKEKGSKFLSYAYPISNEEDIKKHQEELRKVHYDALHHCYAWVLGLEDQSFRANDDGEPNHSAGDPILGQIRSFELTNVLVVVVRYFGGTKLGVGGLINAYKIATEDALRKSAKEKIFETVQVELKFPYDIMSNVERLLSDFDIEVVKRDFQLSCRVEGILKKDLIDDFKEQIKDLYTLDITFNFN
jgi:uncharacterized YigZ family protein